MNSKDHIIMGGFAGALYYFEIKSIFNEQPTLAGCLGCITLGCLGGKLPDLLEPATSGSHRRFFHSTGIGILGIFLLRRLIKNGDISKETKMLMGAPGMGYLSHLALDSLTPRSLPLC